ncbi:ATP-binding Cassette (ABC) Superfamily [Thraustotheca clavata]|uniref:ATP-binding Cassette (ABC) Superfamily n=1 Tax=Thraustotheca clavata TaxID=74557 RepID=A0A1V9Z4Y6_9STRA|nr:ATP-binding Cassette (ABC) Superfamily [Thraustotheca clavata]
MTEPIPTTADGFLQQGSDDFHAAFGGQLETAMGPKMPQMEIRFHNLAVTADVAVATKDGHELPTLYNDVKKSVMQLFNKKRSIKKDILHPMSGSFRPGTMTLVLGQPSSGKSSLMRVLSGRFPIKRNIQNDGSVTYNGINSSEIKEQLPKFTSYVNQRNFHYPRLTVKETLEFAYNCNGGARVPQRILDAFDNGTPEEIEYAKKYLQSLYQVYPDIITRQMGLTICQDTIIGNDQLRGVSGGECKRVTVGEMEFGMKQVSFLDEISTGLDSAAAYDIVKSQKSMAESLRKTIVIALLQPSPELFNLFDEILLLNDGYVLYHGPRSTCLSYFESLGFVCPEQRDIADFLLDLGTPEQTQYLTATNYAIAPHQPSEFAAAFEASVIYKDMMEQMEEPISDVQENESREIAKTPGYEVSYWPSLWQLTLRQLQVYLRNKEFVQSRIVMVLLLGLLYSTTYYQAEADQVITVAGVIFVAVLFLALGQLPLMPSIIDAREIYYKQRDAHFFRTSTYVLALSLTQIPVAVLETLIFGSLMYWITGFTSNAGAFLIYLLLLFVTNLVFNAWFFFLAAVSQNLNAAQPISMVTVLLYVIFSGFIMFPDDMPDYFTWIYWIDPLAWATRALMINEYSADEFQVCVYNGIDYCKVRNATMGNAQLLQVGCKTEKKWIWFGILFLALCYVLFLFMTYLALKFVHYESTDHIVATKVAVGGDDEAYGAAPKTPAGAVNIAVNRAPTTPVTLAFKNLWYSVPNPTKGEPPLKLLKGINGFAQPGTITALMGSSGAGKTTLMDVIAGRKTNGKVEGEILLNGYPATDLAIRRATGYCEQMDIHSESATFREAFQFSAMLRQSDDIPAADKLAFAEECLDLLDMRSIADNIIRGASVEQMKRLTIGVELAASPSILFLDEPTSGLDARSAKIIMTGIRKIASTGRTIVCTIHQPSTEVFMMFDSLLLLKRGGETVYFGELGASAENLIDYFESIPGTPRLQAGVNPAAWMLEIIGAGVETKQTAIIDFVSLFNQSPEQERLTNELNHLSMPSELPELIYKKKRAASSWTQFKLVTKRYFLLYWRTPSYSNTRLYLSIILSVLFGLVYRSVDYTTFTGVSGGVGMIFVTSLFMGLISFSGIIPLAGEERASYYRERASQTYNALWYFVASTIAEIPYVFATTFLFTIIFYPFVGLKESVAACLSYGFNLSLIILMTVYWGQWMAYMCPTIEVAMLLTILQNSIFVLFMGFTPSASQIPHGYRWLYHISPLKYGLATLSAETFAKCIDGTELGCKTLQNVPPTVLESLHAPSITLQDYVENYYEMKYDDRWFNIGITVCYIVLFRILAILSLRYVNHQNK